MQKIKLGIIGLGLAWERLHAPALARLTDKFEIVAVCDKDHAKAQRVAASLGLSITDAYGDYNKMLSRADIEAVESLVPIKGNYETAAAVMRAEKHLIAEKPFASSPKAAHELIKIREKAGVKVMVAENVRYEEQNILIKNLLTSGQIGNPIFFIDNHIVEYRDEAKKGGFGQTEWRQDPEYAGGVIMDSGVHHVARMRFLFGDAQSVYARGRPSALSFAPYSCINGLLTFKENITGHYSFFMAGEETQAPLTGLRIFGTHGEIYLEEPHCGFVNISYKDDRPSSAITYVPGQGYYHELEDFHAALRMGSKIESTPEKALGDIETVYSLLESAKTDQPINPRQTSRLTHAYVLPRLTQYPNSRSYEKV
ncbi:MAG: Gfo/Idh/MocA family oxidoreductase [Defluviitaleaceae bacterium]|nr:Gfo/Idh/MocA family oxidoreductase [Defluviitaleaceae bacterium]